MSGVLLTHWYQDPDQDVADVWPVSNQNCLIEKDETNPIVSDLSCPSTHQAWDATVITAGFSDVTVNATGNIAPNYLDPAGGGAVDSIAMAYLRMGGNNHSPPVAWQMSGQSIQRFYVSPIDLDNQYGPSYFGERLFYDTPPPSDGNSWTAEVEQEAWEIVGCKIQFGYTFMQNDGSAGASVNFYLYDRSELNALGGALARYDADPLGGLEAVHPVWTPKSAAQLGGMTLLASVSGGDPVTSPTAFSAPIDVTSHLTTLPDGTKEIWVLAADTRDLTGVIPFAGQPVHCFAANDSTVYTTTLCKATWTLRPPRYRYYAVPSGPVRLPDEAFVAEIRTGARLITGIRMDGG